MHIKNFKILTLIFLVFLLVSCRNDTNNKTDTGTIIIEEEITPANELREIFYNMYLPDEMTRLFERVGANYDPDIINSPDNFSRYNEDNRIAVAIGIYGVDLGYSRLFEQNLTTARYLTTIELLTTKLGLPDSYFEKIYKRFENNISNQDSVASITTELYQKTDSFLKAAGKDSQAALIVMGGWVEALYIASKILEFNSQNMEIMDRIAEQKYSLNSLISLLGNYQDDIFVAEYYLLLKRLKRTFDKFDILYKQEDFELDTINKKISTRNFKSGLSPKIATEINQVISEIRTLLIL